MHQTNSIIQTREDPWELYDIQNDSHQLGCKYHGRITGIRISSALEGNLGFQLAITLRQKASKTVDHQPSGALTSLSFGPVDPSRSADWNAVIGHFGSEGADGRWDEKRREEKSVCSC
jgi:hypothetical protein